MGEDVRIPSVNDILFGVLRLLLPPLLLFRLFPFFRKENPSVLGFSKALNARTESGGNCGSSISVEGERRLEGVDKWEEGNTGKDGGGGG